MTGGRRWRHEGFGATGEAYLVGPDFLIRSSPRMFFENRDLYFAELKAGRTPDEDIEDIRRYGTPVLQQRVDTRPAAPPWPASRAPARSSAIAAFRRSPRGGRCDFRRQVGADRQDRHRRRPSRRSTGCERDLIIVGGWRCWW